MVSVESPWAPWTAYSFVVNLVEEALTNRTPTLGHLQRNAYNILKVALRSRALTQGLGVSLSSLYAYEPLPDYFSVRKHLLQAGG